MKQIEHTVFVEPESLRFRFPFWALLFPRTDGDNKRERIRRQAEAFINETGADSVVSITEHAPMFGPFSVVIWRYREVSETDTPVIRPFVERP